MDIGLLRPDTIPQVIAEFVKVLDIGLLRTDHFSSIHGGCGRRSFLTSNPSSPNHRLYVGRGISR